MTIYDPVGPLLCEAYDAFCVRVYCTVSLYRLNQELKFLYKKEQIPNEQLYRAHLECASQWQGMWLCVETAINMKLYNINDILYDKWNKSYITYIS